MREIKFRAWNKETKEIEYMENSNTLPLLALFNLENCGSRIFMQYTGLLDKNGKEVFVGDIVSPINFNGSYRDAIIKFKNGCFIVESMGMCKDYECLGDKIGFKIIGNIWENPDLIK